MFTTDILILCALTAVSGINATDDEVMGYFWQLTDLHLDLRYNDNTRCRGRYGHPLCDSPTELIQSAIDATKTLFVNDQRPDFVVWSGDNVAHTNGLSTEDVARSIQFVSQQLQRVFTSENVYVLPVLGNHDMNPANEMSPLPDDQSRLAWCHRLATDPLLWGPWIQSANQATLTEGRSPPPLANFSEGCFFSHLLNLPNSNLLLVSLNGLIWYRENPRATADIPDPLMQLEWLENTFTWARQSNCKILLVSHFPPGASENTPRRYKFLLPHINERFVTLLEDNADLLMTGLFAHTHVDSFRVLSNSDGQPILSLFIGPSISPLRLANLGSFNPRIRLYRYRRSTATLLGYKQFFLNISQSNPHWTLEYDTLDAYGLKDLTASSMSQLLDTFARDDTPDGLWSKYWNHELGGRPHEPTPIAPKGSCPKAHSVCRCEHLCPMRHLDLLALNTCLSSCTVGQLMNSPPTDQPTPSINSSTANNNAIINEAKFKDASKRSEQSSNQSSSLPIIIGVIIAFLAILVGVVLIVNREICRKRGRYTRRLIGSGGTIGGIPFTTVNGAYPVTMNGELGRGHPNQHNNDIGAGTFVSFHPQQAIGDDHSVSTIHTADETMTSPISYGTPVKNVEPPFQYATFINDAKNGPSALFLSDQLKTRRPNGVIQQPSIALVPPPTRHSRASRGLQPDQLINKYPLLNPIMNGAGTPCNLVSPSSMVDPPEEYYADDEAFGDDEDGRVDQGEVREPNVQYSSTSEEDDHEPFDDGNTPFRLDRPRITKAKPALDWKFLKRQSYEEHPLGLSNKPLSLSGTSVPNVGQVQPQNGTIPHSHSTGSGTAHSQNGSISLHSSPAPNGVSTPAELKLNGSSRNHEDSGSSSRRQSGYDYVRI